MKRERMYVMPKADHFAFEVSDMDRAIKFYTEVLGLRLISRQIDEEHNEEYTFLELEGGNLELLQVLDKTAGNGKSSMQPPYCPHIAIGTDDMDSLVQRLREKDVHFVKGPMEIPGEVKWLYISDQDQNVIEYVQWM